MKTSTALSLVKPYLPIDRLEGICNATMLAYSDGKLTVDTRSHICEMLTRRIEPFAFATGWLAYSVVTNRAPNDLTAVTLSEGERMAEWRRGQSIASLQAWRHAWLDSMIAEFKAKGD